jgi:hypothetical protein
MGAYGMGIEPIVRTRHLRQHDYYHWAVAGVEVMGN